MPLHRQVRGDGFPTHNHRRQLQFEVGDFLNQGALVVKHKECRKTRNLGNPSDILETQPSDTLRQKVYYERQAVNPLLKVLSASIPLGRWAIHLYRHSTSHEPGCTSSK